MERGSSTRRFKITRTTTDTHVVGNVCGSTQSDLVRLASVPIVAGLKSMVARQAKDTVGPRKKRFGLPRTVV